MNKQTPITYEHLLNFALILLLGFFIASTAAYWTEKPAAPATITATYPISYSPITVSDAYRRFGVRICGDNMLISNPILEKSPKITWQGGQIPVLHKKCNELWFMQLTDQTILGVNVDKAI